MSPAVIVQDAESLPVISVVSFAEDEKFSVRHTIERREARHIDLGRKSVLIRQLIAFVGPVRSLSKVVCEGFTFHPSPFPI